MIICAGTATRESKVDGAAVGAAIGTQECHGTDIAIDQGIRGLEYRRRSRFAIP